MKKDTVMTIAEELEIRLQWPEYEQHAKLFSSPKKGRYDYLVVRQRDLLSGGQRVVWSGTIYSGGYRYRVLPRYGASTTPLDYQTRQ